MTSDRQQLSGEADAPHVSMPPAPSAPLHERATTHFFVSALHVPLAQSPLTLQPWPSPHVGAHAGGTTTSADASAGPASVGPASWSPAPLLDPLEPLVPL